LFNIFFDIQIESGDMARVHYSAINVTPPAGDDPPIDPATTCEIVNDIYSDITFEDDVLAFQISELGLLYADYQQSGTPSVTATSFTHEVVR
jgi:hypothetical protein